MAQQARNPLTDSDDRSQRFGFLIGDRDATFTGTPDAVFATADITMLRTPPQAPQANTFAEH